MAVKVQSCATASEPMDNLTSNSTNYSDGSSMVNAPAFIDFNVVMLVGFILPTAVLDIFILVAFAVRLGDSISIHLGALDSFGTGDNRPPSTTSGLLPHVISSVALSIKLYDDIML